MGDQQAGAAGLRLGVGTERANSGVGSASLDRLHERALGCRGDAGSALALAVELAAGAPLPGSGATAELWERLATIAAADPTVARVVEPHLDATAILAEQPDALDLTAVGASGSSTWGVYAAEAPGTVLTADRSGDGWHLTGVKPWCSLADRLSHALVTAHRPDGSRGLFAVALQSESVQARPDEWVARGLRDVPSGPVEFRRSTAVEVGAPGWYLERAGFAWGGIGVAAIWWGAAVGVARALDEKGRSREPDQIAMMHLGAVDAALWACRAALLIAADEVDGARLDRAGAGLLAHRTRTIVADAAEQVLRRVGHALGPAPLALDERHAGRVADLELYLRQHHAERDEATLGRAVIARGPQW